MKRGYMYVGLEDEVVDARDEPVEEDEASKRSKADEEVRSRREPVEEERSSKADEEERSTRASLKRHFSVVEGRVSSEEEEKKKDCDFNAGWQAFLGENRGAASHHYNYFVQGLWVGLNSMVDVLTATLHEAVLKWSHHPEDLEEFSGGFSGGIKFVYRGLFFKMPVDVHGVFGSDMAALKGCSKELTNLRVLAKLLVGEQVLRRGRVFTGERMSSSLTIPLAAIIDFFGERLFASVLLPVSDATLVHGSSDGGRTVVDASPLARSEAERVAARLHLKPHRVGSAARSVVLPLAADVEIHSSGDRLYVLDVARLMPPQPPPGGARDKSRIFYEFFRPEFVALYCSSRGIRVSSDAFSGFNRSSDAVADNADLKHMWENYLYSHLPFSAKEMDDAPPPADFLDISLYLHERGINVRHMGRLLAFVRSPGWRILLLTECWTRTAKVLLREQLRAVTRAQGKLNTDVLTERMCELLPRYVRQPDSIREAVKSKFFLDPSAEDEALIDRPRFFASLCTAMGVTQERNVGDITLERGSFVVAPVVKHLLREPRSLLRRAESLRVTPAIRAQFESGFNVVATAFNHPQREAMLQAAVRERFLFGP